MQLLNKRVLRKGSRFFFFHEFRYFGVCSVMYERSEFLYLIPRKPCCEDPLFIALEILQSFHLNSRIIEQVRRSCILFLRYLSLPRLIRGLHEV